MASAPLWDGTAGEMKVIWVKCEAEYFFRRDWTGRNSLIRLEKLDFTRKFVGRALDATGEQDVCEGAAG
jgi:hypothetical protein